MTTTSPADSQLRACGSGGDGCDVRRFVAEHQRGPAEVGEPGGGRDARRSRVVERVQVGRDAALVKDAPGSLRDQAPRETLAAGCGSVPTAISCPSSPWRLMPTPARYCPWSSNTTSACPPNGRSQPGTRGWAVSTHTPASGKSAGASVQRNATRSTV